MGKISQIKQMELRETLRDMLSPFISDTHLEEVVFNIVSAARLAFTAEGDVPERRGIQEAMMSGLNRIETIKTRLFERFAMNYPWKTKYGQEMLEWLSTRPEEETIDSFADWWWADEWRRTRKGAPSLNEIYQFWPRAFHKPEHSSIPQLGIFRAGEES